MYSQGEIVLIPVPFSDLSASKRRPVLIVSNDSYNGDNQDMVVVAITSNLAQTGIQLTSEDMTNGEIPKTSVIRCDKVYTLKQSIVIKRIGRVSRSIQDSVKTEVIKILESTQAAIDGKSTDSAQ